MCDSGVQSLCNILEFVKCKTIGKSKLFSCGQGVLMFITVIVECTLKLEQEIDCEYLMKKHIGHAISIESRLFELEMEK
jgi:hypothetical protein